VTHTHPKDQGQSSVSLKDKVQTDGRQTDTYLIIPASNINSRTDEIDSIRTWASTNNLNLNLKKSCEIVFVDSSRRRKVQLPNPLDGIPRVSSIKILGVTVSSHLSVSEHVSSVIGRCAQTIHALRILRSHGLCNEAIHHVYRSVIIGKLLYAVSAWWGFTSAADRQRLQASYNVAFVVAYVPQKHLAYSDRTGRIY